MLPAASHATSVGRLKTSCCPPAPGGPPRPRPPAGASASAPPPRPPAAPCRNTPRATPPRPPCAPPRRPRRRRRATGRNVFRLRLASEQHHEASFRIELHNRARHLIDDP